MARGLLRLRLSSETPAFVLFFCKGTHLAMELADTTWKLTLSVPRLSIISPEYICSIPVRRRSRRNATDTLGEESVFRDCHYSWPRASLYNIHPLSCHPTEDNYASFSDISFKTCSYETGRIGLNINIRIRFKNLFFKFCWIEQLTMANCYR